MLEVHGLSLGPIGTNCYLVNEAGDTHAFVVDPGDQADAIIDLARERGLSIEAILVTHCHWDHIGAVAALKDATGAPVWMSDTEAPVLEDPDQFPIGGPAPITPATVDHRLEGGERIEVAGIPIDVLSTPGHSPGHLTFLVDGVQGAAQDTYDSPPVAFVGDVIFQGSIGRTDFPQGDFPTLIRGIREKLFPLGDDVAFVPGHGPMSTYGEERAHNPFCGDSARVR